jgi:hypothetical protein
MQIATAIVIAAIVVAAAMVATNPTQRRVQEIAWAVFSWSTGSQVPWRRAGVTIAETFVGSAAKDPH